MESIAIKDWGSIDYQKAWDQQEVFMKKQLLLKRTAIDELPAGETVNPFEVPTTNRLILCRHPHVYTIGKSGKDAHLLANEEMLKAIDATFVRTNRGGDITYHGPGQIVGYPQLDLEKFFTDLGKYMRFLEEVIIKVLARYELVGERLQGSTGVWLDAAIPGQQRKICAMGVRCSRWLTMHGFALNVNTDLSYFTRIVPCGITDKGVTSLEKEMGRTIDEQEVQEFLIADFGEVFNAVMTR